MLQYVEDTLRHVEAMLRRRSIASTLRFYFPSRVSDHSNGIRNHLKRSELKYKVMRVIKIKGIGFRDEVMQKGPAICNRGSIKKAIKKSPDPITISERCSWVMRFAIAKKWKTLSEWKSINAEISN